MPRTRYYVEGNRIEGDGAGTRVSRVGMFASPAKALAFMRTLLAEGYTCIDTRTYDEKGCRAPSLSDNQPTL